MRTPWIGLALAFLLIGAPQALPCQPSRVPTIVVATDIHYLAPQLHDSGKAFSDFLASGDGKDLGHIESIVDAWLAEVARLKPDFVLITGDLTTNGEAASHEALAAKLHKLVDLGIGVAVIPGNHDLLNPWARAFRGDRQLLVASLGPEAFARTYWDLGYGTALACDPASLSYTIQIAPGLRVLMLDSNRYMDNAQAGGPITGGQLSAGTLQWIRSQAAAAKAAKAILLAALHHSVVDHSKVIQEGYTLDNAEEVQSLLSELGIRLALTGHIHIQDATMRKISGKPLFDIAGNALSVYPNQYGILTFNAPAQLLEYRTQRVDVSSWAKAQGLRDPYLLSFTAASEAAFSARAIGLLARVQERSSALSPGDATEAARVLGILNLRYFAGQENANIDDLSLSYGLGLLKVNKEGFLSAYVSSILQDDEVDDNHVVISISR